VVSVFGPFELDPVRRRLVREGERLHLTPKAFDLLTILVSEAPRVVPKAELHRLLWPNTFVSESTLAGLVKEIRRALNDSDRRDPIIRTAHSVGYALSVEVETAKSPLPDARHWLAIGGHRFPLRAGDNVIGRDDSADVRLDSPSVSRRHATIAVSGDRALLADEGSKNGTRVDEQRLTESILLRDGQRLHFGLVLAVYGSSGRGTPTQTQVEIPALGRGGTSKAWGT